MQKQEFVEQRRVALEKYLRRLADHPVIRKSDEFRVFLQVQGKLPLPTTTDVASRVLDGAVKLPKQLMGESLIAPSEVVQPAKGGRDLLRLFKELKQAESLVKAQQDMGETMGELGLAFIKLTKFENEEAVLDSQKVRATDMKGVATAAVKASRLFRELNSQTVKHLVNNNFVMLILQLYICCCCCLHRNGLRFPYRFNWFNC
jgi:hypothetical protein